MPVYAMTELLVFSTAPDRDTAERIATALIDERLAACVSLLPGVTSIYRWNGAVERGEEIQLLIKTTRDRFDALKVALVMLHPYELPELLAVEAVSGLDRYLQWVRDSTSAG